MGTDIFIDFFGKFIVVSLYEHPKTPAALEQRRDWLSESSAR